VIRLQCVDSIQRLAINIPLEKLDHNFILLKINYAESMLFEGDYSLFEI